MKAVKLYQTLSEKQLKSFLMTLGISLENEKLVEINNKPEDLFGDFIITTGYKFKRIYSNYQCMETPTDKHKKKTLNFQKAPNDYYKKT
jgi:hypothetical protein